MSARSRGRGNTNQDADEERRLWKEIQDKANEVDVMVTRSNEIGHEILQVETQQATLLEAGKRSDSAMDERLEKLYRENVKLCEQVDSIIEGGNDMNLLTSINILKGLRGASEESAAQSQIIQGQRSASGKAARNNKKGATKGQTAIATSTEDSEETAAAPSPRISLGPNRLNAREKPSRSGSIATTREASVKIEDGDSVASSADGASTATGPIKTSSIGNRPNNRMQLRQGEIVFCRHDPKNFDAKKGEAPEGEGILCRVTNVIGEGKQRRYEVQDADPSGEPPPPQRASVAQLIQIPSSNRGLGDLTKGKQVLAQYPDTTTFYKAEVNELWKAKDLANGEKGELVRLNFQDDEQPREVERRFVLTEK